MSNIVEEPKADYFFEVSWEVCNKVGGIYTVVSSKAESMAKRYKHYFLIGPYFPKKALGEFQESVAPDAFRQIFENLKHEGIICHYGKWLVDGAPDTILIDFSQYAHKSNEIKTKFWEYYHIDSLNTTYFDFDEPLIWAYSVGRLIDAMVVHAKSRAVAQFHEWLSAGGLLYLKKNNPGVATVFTTHATMLGRTLASNNVDLYNMLEKIDADSEAYRFGIQAKHLTEKAAALHADIFTTVSEITGMEAAMFYGRKPDILLPNGLNLSKFPSMEEIAIKHSLNKTKIKAFLLYHFFPYYSFDLDKTYIYFIVGRYEYHDKGIDVFIRALGKLNEMLKKEKSSKTVVAFFWIPANVRGIKTEIIECRSNFMDIHESIEDSMPDIKNSLILSIATNREISAENVFDNEMLKELKRKSLKLVRQGKPPLATHDIYDEQNDSILKGFAANGLTNSEEDRVKVVFYPIYLTGADNLLDLNYYEAIIGSHLGVFPSYYEPWGYTPLEAAALGVASVTTDLSGFGRYICKDCAITRLSGVYTVKRLSKPDEAVVEDLKSLFYDYTKFSREERIATKYEAKKIAASCDWGLFSDFYIKAHNMALEKHT